MIEHDKKVPISDSEINKEVAVRLLDAMNQGDTQAIYDSFAEEGYSITMGNIPLSGVYPKAKIVELAGKMLDVFPHGLVFSITGMIAEGNKVAVEAVSEGLHISGTKYSNEYHFLFTLKEGKILSVKEYMDTDIANRVLCGGGG